MKRRKKKRHVIRKLCDPQMCSHCDYVGDGDFLCDDYPGEAYVVVISDWEQTDHYLHCLSRTGEVRES